MNRLLTTILAAGALLGGGVYGKTLEEETPVLAQALAKQLVAKQRPKVSALDFTNIQGMPNELGRFLAEQLAVDMVSVEGITVLDRANISAVMAEHQLTAEGLVKPENAKKLGQFAGVDALLIGNVAALDKTFTLTVKAISTETAEVVAAGRCKFDVTEDLMKQFSSSITSGAAVTGGGNTATGNGTPSSQDASGIAKKKFDNLEIVLMSVTRSSAQVRQNFLSGTTSTPVINCWFEIYNRNLKNTAIIAANGLAEMEYGEKLQIDGCRGGLDDSNSIHWLMPSDSMIGMSAVLCFDYERNSRLKQNNFADAANYIQKGKKVEYWSVFGHYQNAITAIGKYWTGSFTPIPPGQSIRVTVGFSPDVGKGQQNAIDTILNKDKQDAIKIPQSFQMSMELVIGSVMDGGGPETAKDLRLENVTFDKIVMPDLVKQFNSGINDGTVMAKGGNNVDNESPSSQDSVASTKKLFENLEIVLMSAAPSTTLDENKQSIPVINCSFELYNRDLKNTVIIGANGGLDSYDSIEIKGYRVSMDDSNGIRWWIPKDLLKGMSAILCFESIRRYEIAQNNPADAVNYIRKGTKVEFGELRKQKILERRSGKCWAGSFTTISPGKSAHVTVGLIPKVSEDSQQSGTKIPQSFQFGMELVIGSVMEGEAPETAKNLRLENLTFDKIVIPYDQK